MNTHKHEPMHDPAELNALVNKLRVQLQDSTCCPVMAMQVLGVVLATFVLDIHAHEPRSAADDLERIGKQLAGQVREGSIVLYKPNNPRVS